MRGSEAQRPFAAIAAALALAASAPAAASPAQDYMLFCMGCHGSEAQGVPGKVPPLAGALAKFMRSSAGRNYVLRVPGAQNSVLDDARLAGVLNWLALEYGGEDLKPNVPLFSTEEVAALRKVPLAAVLATRREVLSGLAASGSTPPLDY